ncbi:13043_t:CDS:2 [Gigaspora margarita]|uniref:13043_t:CDS:1 n=1 Tax=Gigaspora margarita TaxID=4874 RepID=A0ABN7UE72_GIGMA|nr:13043_t:CDS:2 [Gigaspora margarita]
MSVYTHKKHAESEKKRHGEMNNRFDMLREILASTSYPSNNASKTELLQNEKLVSALYRHAKLPKHRLKNVTITSAKNFRILPTVKKNFLLIRRNWFLIKRFLIFFNQRTYRFEFPEHVELRDRAKSCNWLEFDWLRITSFDQYLHDELEKVRDENNSMNQSRIVEKEMFLNEINHLNEKVNRLNVEIKDAI